MYLSFPVKQRGARRQWLACCVAAMTGCAVQAQTVDATAENTDSTAVPERQLRGATVRTTRSQRMASRVENVELIGPSQLVRAACCNLGESFTNNPSVDVSYADPATGARQIKLLGLSGTYVQMLDENVPTLRGAALPYALGFVPGPWMQSIQVSKGAAGVKHGYESLTGQINVEYLKPQGEEQVLANAYLDSKLRWELNAAANKHLTDRLSASLLLHYEDRRLQHDGNDDSFADMPRLRQYNGMMRWAYVSPKFISQFFLSALRDEKASGQLAGHAAMSDEPLYHTSTLTDRVQGVWKNACILNAEHNTSVALILQGTWHDAAYRFGLTDYGVTQRSGLAQALFETDFTPHHALAVGATCSTDDYREHFIGTPMRQRETVTGLYAQYTYKLASRLTLMPGLRWDYSTLYGSFLTPRLHVKYSALRWLTLRASAGRGYRTPHALAEQTPLLASGRSVLVAPHLQQEAAWNAGLSASCRWKWGTRTWEWNAEYYLTDFARQMVVNVDGAAGAHTLVFENLRGKSRSHTFQTDLTIPLPAGVQALAAFRYQDARTTYDGLYRLRPLTSRFKGMLSLSWKSPLEIWQLDLTGQLNGHGVLYDRTPFPTYFQLQAQVTREFRRCSLYVGGENLTNYRMAQPVIHASHPWSQAFDATQIWGPTDGAMAYVGMRFKWKH